MIVDEFTGRLAEGRKWRAGMHQAVEAKEDVEVTVATGQAARITMQDFFLRYPRLAGMTGTGQQLGRRAAEESTSCAWCRFPRTGPPSAQKLPTAIFGTADAKWEAIVDEVVEVHATGRPVLIGTRSIDKSELLSQTARRRPAFAHADAQRQQDRRRGRDRRRTPASPAK